MSGFRLKLLWPVAAVGAILLGSASLATAAPMVDATGHPDIYRGDPAVQDVYWVWHHHHRYWVPNHRYYR